MTGGTEGTPPSNKLYLQACSSHDCMPVSSAQFHGLKLTCVGAFSYLYSQLIQIKSDHHSLASVELLR
jgi:hypothetical protein